MTGEHESSNQEVRARAGVNVPWVKGPFSLLVKATIKQTKDEMRRRDKSRVSKAHSYKCVYCSIPANKV